MSNETDNADLFYINSIFSTDWVASEGAHFQRIKLGLGADGAFDGDVHEFNPLPTSLSRQSADAFGRLRVSETTTLLDIKHTNDKNPTIVDEVVNATATSVHSTTNASVLMSTAASGDYVIKQTFQRAPYFAGKSQEIYVTFDNFSNETNITKRVGYFNSSTVAPYTADLDGIFLESDGSEYYLCIYKTGIQTLKLARSSWDDPLDGTGPSGVTIDFTKSNILNIDFEYLGVGGVRFTFVKGFSKHTAHIYNHASVGDSTYMTDSNHSIRYEIRQTGVGSGSLEMICSTVGTEGSVKQIGYDGTINQGINNTDADSTANTYALCGIRQASGKENIYVHIADVSVLSSTNDNFLWSIIRNPTVAGTFTFSAADGIEGAVASGNTNIVTNGSVLLSGYGSSNTSINFEYDTSIHLGTAIDGTHDEFILCVRPLGTNANFYGAINWLEQL